MRRQDSNLRPPGYEAVSSTNRSHFGSDVCFLPPFARRVFHCFRPALPNPILFWVKTGSEPGCCSATSTLSHFIGKTVSLPVCKVVHTQPVRCPLKPSKSSCLFRLHLPLLLRSQSMRLEVCNRFLVHFE